MNMKNEYEKIIKHLKYLCSDESSKNQPNFMKIEEGAKLFGRFGRNTSFIKDLDFYFFNLEIIEAQERWEKFKSLLGDGSLSKKEAQQILNLIAQYPPKPSNKKGVDTCYENNCFDFKNQQFWNISLPKDRKPFKTKTADGKKTNYWSFKCLLQNKGRWLSFDEIHHESQPPSIKNCKGLREYFIKNLVPKIGIRPECLELSSSEKKIRLIDVDRVS